METGSILKVLGVFGAGVLTKTLFDFVFKRKTEHKSKGKDREYPAWLDGYESQDEKPNQDSWEQRRAILHKHAGSNEQFKMVLLVRGDLNMTKGKMCAQCGHAVFGVMQLCARYKVPIEPWIEHGQAKIALRVNNEEELEELAKKAEAAGLPSYAVIDAGKTQVAPESLTVLALGPGPNSVIDGITRHLKLL